jgi:hypothetical protein
MRLAVWLRAGVGVSGALSGTLGCDATYARPAHSAPSVPPGVPLVVVDCVGAMCAVEDEDEPEQWLPEDRPAPVKPVEYVKMSEWTPPPSVQALEAVVPPRGDEPPTYIQFPKLTKHSSIGGMHSRRH